MSLNIFSSTTSGVARPDSCLRIQTHVRLHDHLMCVIRHRGTCFTLSHSARVFVVHDCFPTPHLQPYVRPRHIRQHRSRLCHIRPHKTTHSLLCLSRACCSCYLSAVGHIKHRDVAGRDHWLDSGWMWCFKKRTWQASQIDVFYPP